MSRGSDLIVHFIGDTTSLERGFKKTQSESEKTSSHFSKLGGFALGAAGAVGGALVVGLEKSIKAAMDAQASEKSLEQSLRNTHQSVEKMKPALEAAAGASRKLGFSDEDTAKSLARLEIATGSTKKSVKDLAVVQDLARVKHIDLATATNAVATAMVGSQRAARQLGITVPAVTDAVDAVKEKYKGLGEALKATYPSMTKMTQAQRDQYDAAANNLQIAEAADKAQAIINDRQATGANVIQAVSDKVKGQAKAFADSAAGGMAQFHAQIEHIQVTVGNKLLPVLTKLVQWLAVEIPVAMDKLSRFWKQHGDQIIAVMNTIKNTFQVAFALLSAIITTFSDLLHGRWSKLWNDVKQIFVAEIGIIVQYFRIQIQLIEAVLGKFISRIGAAFRGLGQILAKIMAAAIDAVIAAWNAFHIPSVHIGFDTHIPGVGKVGFDTPRIDFPDIPLLDTGGRITSTGLAVLHSGEEVVPAQVARGGGGGVNVYVAGSVVTEQQLEDVIYRALLRRKQRTGALGLA